MADNAKMTQATPQEIIISTLAGLIAPLIAIFLIFELVSGIQARQTDTDSPDVAARIVENNIKPFAKLEAVDANAIKEEKSGQEIYDSVCSACHGSGALGAPKYQNKGDWGPRIGKGLDTLTQHALEGFKQMPPRGGNPDLSDTEVGRAIVYMANAAGATFKEPAGPPPPPAVAELKVIAATAAAATAAAEPAATAAAELALGKKVFEGTCKACHETGVAGAPKFGDKAAWAPRIKMGYQVLYTSAVKGKNAMPPKGGNAGLAYADVKAAVDYMVSKAK